VVVLEADEYDRSFLRLSPFIASISSMDPDHLDIYGDSSVMIDGFKAYAGPKSETTVI
jgi:UDP-N-acetylmuramate--alanine ligase